MHDWTTPRMNANISSSLTSFLQTMNSLELSSISVTLNGVVTVLESGHDSTEFFLRKHLDVNPVDSKMFVDKPDIAVIKVRVSSARIADLEDHVEKWRGEGEIDTPIDDERD